VDELTGQPAPAAQPVAAFRAALSAAAERERGSRTRRADRLAAIGALSATDLASLGEAFEAMLGGRDDVGAMAERLHATLRARCPEPLLDQEADHA
jgi:hypothetical protein